MPFVGLGASMIAHFGWNSFAGFIMNLFMGEDGNGIGSLLLGLPLATLIIQGPFALFLLGAVWFLMGTKHPAMLKHESASVVSKAEYDGLTPSLKRTLRSIGRFFQKVPLTGGFSINLGVFK